MKKLLVLFLIFPLFSFSQQDLSEVKVKTTEIAPDLHRIYIGDGVAMLAYFSEEEVLLVDAAYERTSEKVMDKLKELGNAHIRFIINTHYHGDHTGGNKAFGRDVPIISHHYVKDLLSKDRGEGDQKQKAFPEYARPDLTFSDSLAITFNGQTISLIHLPGGHTAGDILVYFTEAGVLSMGDLLFAGKFPYVDIPHGGNALQYIKHVKWITETFPEDIKIIGGHGPVYQLDQLREYCNTLEKTVQVIRQAKKDGQSLEQMKENKILKDWKEFGTGFISEGFWIETVYNSL